MESEAPAILTLFTRGVVQSAFSYSDPVSLVLMLFMIHGMHAYAPSWLLDSSKLLAYLFALLSIHICINMYFRNSTL